MVRDLKIYVEGEFPQREGLSKLFHPFLKGRNPFFMMGGKTVAIKNFREDTKTQYKFLMIDLDNQESKNKEDEKEFKYENKENVVYMIQETEAWFISQPEVLNQHFNFDIYAAIKKEHPFEHVKELSNPKEKLKKIVKKNTTTTYKENRDGVALMRKLKLEKLKADFKDVENLITILEQ